MIITLALWEVQRIVPDLPNAGFVYLPLLAMLAYHWRIHYALWGMLLQLLSAYWLFLPPSLEIKTLPFQQLLHLITLAVVTAFVLAIVQLARTRHQTALHEAKRLDILNNELDTLFESITDGILLVDEQGRILRENRSSQQIHHLLVDDTEQSSTLPALLEQLTFQALACGTVLKQAVSSVSLLGNTWDYEIMVAPLRPPSQASIKEKAPQEKTMPTTSRAVVVWHDVTEARRLLVEQTRNAEMEARQTFLQTILDELPGGVFLVSGPHARLVLANQAAQLAWGAACPLGQSLFAFFQEQHIRHLSGEGQRLSLDQLAVSRALQQGETIQNRQEIIHHADGTTLPILVNAVPLSPAIIPATARMVELQEAHHQHERAVLVVLQDVTVLKEAERLKDEFIGTATHELRNPLAVLKGYVQVLKRQSTRKQGAELSYGQLEALQEIDQATTRLVDLMEDLLDVTRLQAGRFDMYPSWDDLVAVVRRVVGRLQITTDRHRLEMKTDRRQVLLSTDVRRLEQVLENVIQNAIKYSPNGGNIDVCVRTLLDQQQVQMCVRDWGIGIPREQQPHIFRRFVRADNARAHTINGTGLGLYLCRELIERLGGQIWFESVEGEGSTFFIVLPLTSDEMPDTLP